MAAAFFSRGEGDVSSCGHADAPVFAFRVGSFCRDVTACPDLYISFPNKDCPFVFYGTVFQVVVAVCNALGIVVCMHGTYADVTAGGQQGSAFFAQLFQFRTGEGQVIFCRQEEQTFFVFDGDACCFCHAGTVGSVFICCAVGFRGDIYISPACQFDAFFRCKDTVKRHVLLCVQSNIPAGKVSMAVYGSRLDGNTVFPLHGAAVFQILFQIHHDTGGGNKGSVRAQFFSASRFEVYLRDEDVFRFPSGQDDFLPDEPDDISCKGRHLFFCQFDARFQIIFPGKSRTAFHQCFIFFFVSGIARKISCSFEFHDLLSDKFLFIEAVSQPLHGFVRIPFHLFVHVVGGQEFLSVGKGGVCFNKVCGRGFFIDFINGCIGYVSADLSCKGLRISCIILYRKVFHGGGGNGADGRRGMVFRNDGRQMGI
ncbi:unknown [Dialister invisus CAG:218]|nr:unknown [Dialister invisus CAG:218]